MRLTKKQRFTPFSNYELNFELDNGKLSPTGTQRDVINKLGQLEDIEDKLGIDLITFFKFLNSKVCYEKDTDDNEITKCLITGITKTGVLNVQEAFPYGECVREAKFKDYGATWALTKEELLWKD